MTRRPFALFSTVGVVAALLVAAPARPMDALASPLGSPALPRFVSTLPVPAVIDARSGGVVGLDAVNGTNAFSPALRATPSFGYVRAGSAPPAGATYLGPTIEVRRGAPVTLTVTNKLSRHPLSAYVDTSLEGVSTLDATSPRIAVHLHGGHVPATSDGGPTATYRRLGLDAGDAAGGTGALSYRYPNDQEATELWYHDHALGITRLNVMAGLAGLYLVRDGYDTGRAGNPLHLPYGGYEVPLVLQDRSFNTNGTLSYPVGAFVHVNQPDYPDQWAPEYFGDVATVNGRAWPDLPVDSAIYRFRVVNGSNSRVYRLSLQTPGGAPVRTRLAQVGAEGGLLDAPVALDHLLIAPGERADLLVDFRGLAKGTRIVLGNDAETPYSTGTNGPGDPALAQIMQFTATGVAAPVGQPTAIPKQLRIGSRRLPALPTTVAGTRTVLLNEVLDPATGEPTEVLINNLGYHQHNADGSITMPRTTDVAMPRLNTVEYWDIVNTTADAHPIHLHLTQFRVVSRTPFDVDRYLAERYPALPAPSGSDQGPWPPATATAYVTGSAMPPAATEQGWKDTVLARPGQITRIAVPFGGSAAGVSAPFTGDPVGVPQRFLGEYLLHCHILEHEDNDMMQPFRVVP